jgi:HAD superfamily 5'-nucleotidase-like hydrolase
MDRHKVVYKGYHGTRRLSREQLVELYHHRRIRPHTPRYHWIDTLFSLSEVTSYAAIVDALERRGERIDYGRLFSDVRAAIDEAHADGTVYSIVTADLPRFVDRDPDLARALHKLRSAGKRLFLLTNSPWSYTDRMMSYLLGNAMPEYPSWQHYFDVAICAAAKPLWFREGRPLMERDGDVLRNVHAPLERGRLYEGGNLREFERLTGLQGSSVLYVGDHIYGDILRSKKESSWRTAMIIQELDAEIVAHEACVDDIARQRQLEETRDRLEDELRFYQARFKDLSRGNSDADVSAQAERLRVKRALERVRGELRSIEQEYEILDERIDKRFHPYWGSLLKEHTEMSMFGLQVDMYADIYTRRVSCLQHYSPQQFFRSPHDLMPHEI